MRVHALTAGLAAAAVIVAAVAACGGGYSSGSMGSGVSGSGGGGYGGGNTPAPTASFTAPAQAVSINLGQAVKLAWTSSNATSCTAATSSTTGGTFAGSQSLAGQASVVPTATGSVTYTLTCSGSGGMMKATSPVVMVNPPIISLLASSAMTTIGSAVDPMNGDGNPYGLAIAPATSGLITAGDLVVCNFNDKANTQGAGTTIVGLHPTPGANPGGKPYRIAQDAKLQGCNAIAMLPDDNIAAAAFTANMNLLVSPTGTVNTPFASDSFAQPWGEVYVAASGGKPAALYVSNFDGSIDRIELSGDAQTSFTQIATGFCGSGAPGSIYAPTGLTYDASIDTLYIVDTSSFSVVAFANVSSIGAGGVVVSGNCKSVANPPTPAPTFGGPSASSARVIAHGAPLFAPISAALLANGDLIVINDDINITTGQTPNLAVEVSPVLPSGFVGQPLQLDNGAPGALFGIVATVDGQGHQIVYYNDDNAPNTVVMLATSSPVP
jgi:hypothetical protein